MNSRLITMKEVLIRVPLSKSEIYRRIKTGAFPTPLRLGPQRIAFVEQEIDEWMSARASTRVDGGQTNG